MPDHAKEYSFDVIEFAMRANESCFDQFEFGKTLLKVFKFYVLFKKRKSVCLGSRNKGSNCEGKILAYKKNKLCLISNLYIKITNEECFIRYKDHARDALSVF